MTTIELVHKHIRHDPSDGKVFFVFDTEALDKTPDGGSLLREGSKVLDFELVMKQSGKPATAEAIGEVINELLKLREQGKFEDFL